MRVETTIVKYYAQWAWSPRVCIVRCERESDLSVWVDGRPHRKLAVGSQYFDTFEEAKSKVVAAWEARVADARRSFESANGELSRAKGFQVEQCKEGRP